jgi:hypothetical protein
VRVPIAPLGRADEITSAPQVTFRLRRFRPAVLIPPAVLLAGATAAGVVLAVKPW